MCFVPDPHPGNVLISRDQPGGEPRLALVDYGQVKVLTHAQRLQAARLMVALARADAGNPAHRRAVCALASEMGAASARGDADIGFELVRVYFDRDDLLVTRGMNTQAFIGELSAQDPPTAAAQAFVLMSRASLLLRGLGHCLNQHRSCAQAWAPIAERVLREAGAEPVRVLLLVLDRAEGHE